MPGPEGVHSQPLMEGMLPPFVQERLDQFRRDTVGDEGPSVAESLTGFAHAVAWRDEPWIIGILCGHALLLAAAITTRHIVPAQVGLFLVTLGLTACAEPLNSLGARHWEEFATQNYFDEHGVFASTVFSAPLLLVAFVIMAMSLRNTAEMLVVVKRAELQREMAQRGGGGGGGEQGDAGGETTGGETSRAGGKGVRRRGAPASPGGGDGSKT